MSFVWLWAACHRAGEQPAVDPRAGDDPTVPTTPVGPAITTRPSNPTCVAPDRLPPPGEVTVDRLFPDRSFGEATLAIQPPDDPGRWWIVRQEGRIESFDVSVASGPTDLVVDLTDRVDNSANEAGLLGLAFDPGWATNRELILSYTAPSAPFRSTIARFRASADGRTIDPGSEQILLTLEQPFTNHNGGNVVFGHDGMLYVGFGDGGSGGDPYGNGQNLDTLLGKILRIDVHGAAPYAIPPDNPFAGGGGRPEIYAWGLRNPWRFSVDPASGDLWVGDVGQDRYEEVDIVRNGGNYGWNTMEADSCYGNPDCDPTGLVLPVVVTRHDEGDNCITGGVVYRGAALPQLQGSYVFADYASGRVYARITDPVTGEVATRSIAETSLGITHIATDAAGEVVLLDRNTGLYRLDPNGAGQPAGFPETLSATGCFDPADPSRPGPALVPYTVAHPFWSDGADKDRWVAIPDGTTVEVDAGVPQGGGSGELVLPIGSVVV
ncbi:MAG: PQQ-dependent sugar dehydrogenase, partial [Myxococcota bacterium]